MEKPYFLSVYYSVFLSFSRLSVRSTQHYTSVYSSDATIMQVFRGTPDTPFPRISTPPRLPLMIFGLRPYPFGRFTVLLFYGFVFSQFCFF